MKQSDIIEAYCKIRTIDQTIPDDVLDFMKNAAIDQIKKNEEHELYLKMKNFIEDSKNWKKDGAHYKNFKYGLKTLKEAYDLETLIKKQNENKIINF